MWRFLVVFLALGFGHTVKVKSALPAHVYPWLPQWQENVDVRDLIRLFPAIDDAYVGRLYAIEAGTFMQGASGEPCSWIDEEPPFEHTLTRDFAVMETEVSRQMWADLKVSQASLPDDPTNPAYAPTMNHPVQDVTWNEALLFANLLSEQQGLLLCYFKDPGLTVPLDAGNYNSGQTYCDFDADGYRLPTEGEWEYFCRATSSGCFSIEDPAYTHSSCPAPDCVPGEFPVLETAAIFCANASGSSAPVGSKASNPWGLRDVHGNVFEWCWDWYEPDYPIGPQTDYISLGVGSLLRVVRGGSWEQSASEVRSANRWGVHPLFPEDLPGFRLVRTL